MYCLVVSIMRIVTKRLRLESRSFRCEVELFCHLCDFVMGLPNLKSIVSAKRFEAPQTTATPNFIFRCDFIIGLGEPKLYTKFKFTSFSH